MLAMAGDAPRAIFLLLMLGALATPANAQSIEVLGYAGVLGEWELTASVTGNDNKQVYSGPLTMTHVGICTVDGPEEKKGEIRLQVSQSSSRLSATLLVDGVTCTYTGHLSDSYTGVMDCPNRSPVPLNIWLK
jgi:hypothetical protein